MAGELSNRVNDLLLQTFTAMTDRLATESAFTPDLQPGIQPILAATRTNANTLNRVIQAQLNGVNEVTLMFLDQLFQNIGAENLLLSALNISQAPVGEQILNGTITLENGARKIPWLDIVKEIITIFVRANPLIPSIWRSIIFELLRILDKYFEGQIHSVDSSVATPV
ncbi:MAG: hypothetical protein F6J97_16150 [Leptolyngbya sp. SIO4C1]|nr:hypothetical protein [Leptolyngbya sp. SIO4C1]